MYYADIRSGKHYSSINMKQAQLISRTQSDIIDSVPYLTVVKHDFHLRQTPKIMHVIYKVSYKANAV